MKLNQLRLVTAMMAEVSRQMKEHGIPDTCETFQVNAIINGANLAVQQFSRERVDAKPGTGLSRWLVSDDVGMSSKFMACVMMDAGTTSYAHPHDPSDFNRCVKFLKAVPEARAKLPLMAGQSHVWKALVENWDSFEKMLEEEFPKGRAPKLYEAMKTIGC